MIAWTLVAGCVVVLALPLVWRVAQRRLDPFEPVVLFALAFGAMFVARPASILGGGDHRFWGVDVLPTLPRALTLALVGAVAFATGYELGWGSRAAARLPAPSPIRTRAAAAGALAVAGLALIALAALLVSADGLESLRILLGGRSAELGDLLKRTSNYLWYGSLLFAPAAFVLVALAFRERSRFLWTGAALVLLVALLRLVPVGGRIVLLPLFGGIFALVYLMRQRRPGTALLAVIGGLALLGSYFVLHLRDPTDDLTLRTAAEELKERPHAVFDPVLHGPDAEMVLALSAALTVVPDELPYRWGGATVGNLVTRPIPRELWPDKPVTPGETVVATLWPHLYPGLNPAFSPLLVFYWDLGVPGVAVGMALFGLVARSFYEWLLLHRRSFAAQMLYAIGVWFVIIGARNDPVDTFVLGMFLFAPVLAVLIVASEAVHDRVASWRSGHRATR